MEEDDVHERSHFQPLWRFSRPFEGRGSMDRLELHSGRGASA